MTSMTQQADNDNGYRAQDLLGAAQAAFCRLLDAQVGTEADFATRERAGLELGNALCRADQQQALEQRSAQFTTHELEIDGKRYRRHSRVLTTGLYHGLCGTFPVKRALYREVGIVNGPTVVPLELDAGLMERATPGLAYALAEGYAQSPSRQAHEAMHTLLRLPPSRSTTERIAKGLGEAMGAGLRRIEGAVRATERLPQGACALSVGLDRTSVPMEEPAGPDKKSVMRTSPRVRKALPPVEVNYRMSYVGTFSVVDADGRALVTRRYGISGSMDPIEVVESLRADVEHALAQRDDLPVGIVQDGAPEMWNLMRDCLAGVPALHAWHEAIDRHHVLERLSEALQLAGLTRNWCQIQLQRWNHALDADDGAIDAIEVEICNYRDGLRGDARRKLSDHVTYLENNKDRMRYARLRTMGLPVGSGATEGACKSLVMTRAKRCGQRWHEDGIDAVLLLRGLLMSERLPAAFDLLRRDYMAIVRPAA